MTAAPALALEHIGKRFGHVVALDDVTLSIERGTVHAVLGENGAGKSTAMRIVAGLIQPDTGSVHIDGARVADMSPARAISLGVGMVHQHFMLVDNLSVAENVVLGREPVRGAWLDRRKAEDEVRRIGEAHGLAVDPRATVESLSVGQRQRVEILKTLYRGARLLILDEPTAVLAPAETRALLDVMKKLAEDGATVVFVTHKLDEVMDVATTASVLRRGRHVRDVRIAETTTAELASAMVGRTVVLGEGPARSAPLAADAAPSLVLDAVTVRRGRQAPLLDAVSLEVRPGEVLGIAGVEGNGQRELEAVIAGLARASSGRVRIGGEDVTTLSPAERFERGLAHVPEDRHRQGLVLGFTIWENLSLGFWRALAPRGVLREAEMRDRAKRLVDAFDVRPREIDALASALSGGNQQKVVVARELDRRAHGGGEREQAPRVLVAAQPTRGVDVGAVEEIWKRIGAARDAGSAVLLVSSELGELLALSDRIAVMVRGAIVKTLPRSAATIDVLGAWMLGASAREQAAEPEERADA